MNGHTGRLVDDNHVFVLMHNPDGFRSDGRFMAMQRMADYIAVLHLCKGRRHWLAVDLYLTGVYGIFLEASVRYPAPFHLNTKTYVIFL